MSYGVIVDDSFRTATGGNTISNLYAAGAVLSSFNPIKEASGAGVSLITALHVADLIINKK